MKKILTLLVALLIALMPLTSFAQSFTDSCAREMTLDDSIDRVVVSGPLAQSLLYALAPEKLTALASTWEGKNANYIPSEYLSLPVLGQLYGGKGELNLEELLAAKPQVLIDIGESRKGIAEDMDALAEQTGVPCVHIDAGLNSYPEAFRTLGTLLGCEERAEELAVWCEKLTARTQAIMDKVGENRVKVLYCLGDQGLNVIAKTAYPGEVLDQLVDNVAVLEDVSNKGTGNPVDLEQLMLWDPELILFAPGDLYETLPQDSSWQTLSAISSGKYLEVPEGPMNWMGFPPSIQRLLTMIWLPAALYPDYADYDMQADVQEFYKLFFHCELTQEQYDELTVHAFLK